MLVGGEVIADALVFGTGMGFEGGVANIPESAFDFVLNVFSKILFKFTV